MKSNHVATLIVYLFFIGIMTFGLMYAPKKGHPIALYIPMGIFILLFFHKLFTWRGKANDDGSYSVSRVIGGKRQRIFPQDITGINVSFDKPFNFNDNRQYPRQTILLKIRTPQKNFKLSSDDFNDFDSVVETALAGRDDLVAEYHRQLKTEKRREKGLHRIVDKLWMGVMVVIVLVVVLSYALVRH